MAVVLLLTGCTKSSPRTSGPSSRSSGRDELFPSIAQTLNTLEEYEPAQILPQLRDRLNHWAQQESAAVTWEQDPLVNGLDEKLRSLPIVKTLAGAEYSLADMVVLQEAVWLRDVAQRGRTGSELAVAQRLFDWSVQNIQLEPDPKSGEALRHLPNEILLLGRGTALERAWIFILLCRQQKLNAVMLAIAAGDDAAPRPWLPALAVGGELHLFDTRLGLPIPGPEGQGVATLALAAADEGLLRKLDLDAERSYPVKAEELNKVVALIEGSPTYLARRMKLIDSHLVGKQKVVLSFSPSALAKKLESSKLAAIQLWPGPYELWRRKLNMDAAAAQAALREVLLLQPATPLGKGRVRHFKGDYEGDDGAKKHYMDARPTSALIETIKEHPERMLSPQQAKGVDKAQLERLASRQVELVEEAKQSASYWLGLIAFEEGDYPVAIDYFAKRTLEASPGGPWTNGAKYNLARSYEASEQFDLAIELYEADDSPQAHGNKLRARKLKEAAAEK